MISDKMRELRESTGMSARKFAETLGVKYTTYYGYETGSREPGSDFIVKFADYFHVSVDYLLGIEKEKPSNSAEAEPEGTEKWLIDLLVKGGYLPEGQDLDDRSAAFLLHWLGVLDAWFSKE